MRGFHVSVLKLAELDHDEAAIKLRAAALIVGAHGAGFANIMFLTSSTVCCRL